MAAAHRAWGEQCAILAEDGRVWGDDPLHAEHGDAINQHLADHGVAELVVVPIGAGPEALGMLVVARELGGARWTESESWAALDIGHDLGRAILNTRAQQREQELMAELRRLDDYRIELIRTVSHELKNPLGVILGHVEILDTLPDLPEVAQTSLRALGRSSVAADRRRRRPAPPQPDGRLRHPAPAGAGRPRRRPRRGDRGRDGAGRPAGRDRRDLVVRRQVVVSGDPDLLVRLFANIVNNAVKYSQTGGRVDLSLENIGDEVVFTCTDDGVGISEEDQQQLFTEFFRSTNPVALARPGTGLGLAIVARIVARHGGRIEVDSELGRGTTFRVTLPVAG